MCDGMGHTFPVHTFRIWHSLLENTCGTVPPSPSSVIPLWMLCCAEKVTVIMSRHALLQIRSLALDCKL